MTLFNSYAIILEQRISLAKSTIYSGSILNARLDLISNFMGFNKGSLPFLFLGVPVFKG